MIVLAIDPGDQQSAYCLIDTETLKPIEFAIVKNENLLSKIKLGFFLSVEYKDKKINKVAIEMIASYGMAVGKNVFDTCVWIGRFKQEVLNSGCDADYIYRKEEKMHICGSMRAKDSNITRALIDRFAKQDLKRGKGTKNNPDFFYGFKKDIWASYAVGITYIETKLQAD